MKTRALVALSLTLGACGSDSEPPEETDTADVSVNDTIASFDTAVADTRDTAEPDAARDIGTVDAPDDTDTDTDTEADIDADVPPEEGVATIGAAGGAIETEYARLVVPAGALSRPTELRIQRGGDDLLPFPDEFLASSAMVGFFPEGQVFAEPVTVALRMDGTDPAGMHIWWSPSTLAFWGPEETDFEGEWAFTDVEHFSQGFVGRPTGAYCGDGVAEGSEECDEADLRGLDCPDFELSGEGALCREDCTIDLGACTDPCADVVCEGPPAPSCRTDIRVAVSGEGVCAGGECVYTEETEDCGVGGCFEGECVYTPAAGDIVISEFLVDPDGDDALGEWFEVLNITARRIYVGGLLISDDGSDRIEIPAGTWLEAGAYWLFGGDESAVPGEIVFDWDLAGTFSLNSSDTIELTFRDRLIDRVQYDLTWVIEPNVAQSLSARELDASANDSSTVWCGAYGDYDDSPNTGTPGGPNPACAVCGDGRLEIPEECDDGGRDPGDGCDEFCVREPDLCEGVVCDSPPDEECASDTEIRRWDASCDSFTGECSYAPVVSACDEGFVCVLSACRPDIVPGSVVISEIMAIPVGGNLEEWFEISNFSASPIDLSGMTVLGGSDGEAFAVPFGTVLPASGTSVFAASAGAAGGLVTVVWSDVATFGFSDSGDAIELTYGGRRVHRVEFDSSWPVFVSASMQREDSKPYEELETPNGWCLPGVLYDPANAGTPRIRAHDCPLCGNSILEDGEECDDGNLVVGDDCSADCLSEL